MLKSCDSGRSTPNLTHSPTQHPLNCVISPDAETVTVHRADGTVTKLHNTDVLTGEGTLPGFQCKVSELFVAMEAAASDEA